MSATHPTTGHSCEPPSPRPWPRVVIAIVVIAVVVYAMATGYDVAPPPPAAAPRRAGRAGGGGGGPPRQRRPAVAGGRPGSERGCGGRPRGLRCRGG
jgi:hypothetical protein